MTLTRTPFGWEARFKRSGYGRWFDAAFLAVWLIFWAVGAGFALWLLGMGAWSLSLDMPLEPERAPLALGPALAAGAFLLVWTSLWTLGGVLAVAEFLRLTVGEDRIALTADRLERLHCR